MQRGYKKLIQKKIDTNFAYAILAILSTGFFLWTSISSFILEHDIDQMMISSPDVLHFSEQSNSKEGEMIMDREAHR